MTDINKELIIENHRKMWNWIAEQYKSGSKKCVQSQKEVI